MRTDGLSELADSMQTAKGKGGSVSNRYRPAAEYDDATLAQKREYWRTKKREQRARLSKQREEPTQDSGGKKLLSPNAPAVVNSSLSGSFAAFSSPLQGNDRSRKSANVSPASQGGSPEGSSSVEATDDRKEKWLQTMNLNKVVPQSPASCSISAEAAGVDAAKMECRTSGGAASGAVTSPTPSGTQLNATSSVPPATVARITNGSSAKTTPQPRVSMQGASVPETREARVAPCIQPKLLPANVSVGMIPVSFPQAAVSIKKECEAANTTPQTGTKSALVTAQRAGAARPSTESEEERAAKRREHWRMKKREQRAKVAARIAKVRERTQGPDTPPQRQMPTPQHLPPRLFVRRVGQRQRSARAKASFTSVKRENNESGSASLAPVSLQADRAKVHNPQGNRTSQPAVAQRKLPSHVHLSSVSRGIARFKTPRQRFIEAQKSFLNQRNARCKSTLLASVFGTRNIPKIDPDDTPEQIIAKRREYWRVKKREQRAKLSMEMKARLKEKDSLTRRVKRYQKILEEMRRARALMQSAGSTLAHASETIGGFIKEDGTVTINIPQVATEHSQAARKGEQEPRGVSNNAAVTKPQHQPIRANPTALRPAQVKVSFPLAGQSVNKPSRLLPIRPRTQLESTTVSDSHAAAIQTAGQLTLTHPQTLPGNAAPGASATGSVGGGGGGCVMKLAVSSSPPLLSAFVPDPKLTEDERMAKKREYWRVKKREQRAARATRLKGVLQARALQRRKTQKQAAAAAVPPCRRQPLADSSVPVASRASEIKQEMPAVDLNPQPEQAISPDVKPSTSPAPQPEPDPAQNADSQATTLLAVASMKKLLEESLSTVTECKSDGAAVKVEPTEEPEKPEVKTNLKQLFFEKDGVAPIAANLTLEIKSWQPDTDAFAQAGSQSPHLRNSSQISETLPASCEIVRHPTCEHASQTPSNFIVNPPVEAPDGPSSPRRAQRLRTKKAGRQNCCSPEQPKLHHPPVDQPQRRHQCPAQEPCRNSNAPPAQKCRGVVTEHSGPTSLQRKREYWKLMKRQQRARVKARQREKQGECSGRLSERIIQAPGLVIVNTVKGANPPAEATLQPKSSIASVAAVASVPVVLAVSPARCNAGHSPETLRVKLPTNSVSCSPRNEQNDVNGETPQIVSDNLGARGPRRCSSSSSDVDSAPSLPALKPPDNPLSSIKLQPIEPPGQTSYSSLGPTQIPCARLRSPPHAPRPPTKLAPTSTMVPPKPILGESEEDFLKRKREYWRIKKKEQRARKAIRDKGLTPKRASSHWRAILPAQDLQAQDSGQWLSSSEESEHLMSASADTDPESFAYSDYAAPLEDESELLFPHYGGSDDDDDGGGEEDGPIQGAVWRNRYLMDYDPLHQLLVCMVCGELQYLHSLEGARAHIDEAHPETLTLEPGEQRRILEAWDEQVSQRERFFTNQLQQHSGAMAEAHEN